MPYEQDKGWLHAPVGLASVALCLGESRTDTGTLCRAVKKINPYSLISPRYCKTAPGRAPEYYSDGNHTADVPPSKQSLILGFDLSTKTPDDYPCISEYAFTKGANVAYDQRRWGYWVPYVRHAEDIFALSDLTWLRFSPADDADETAPDNKSWCRLDEFDGYLHNAKPTPVMSNVHLEYGEKPAYTPVISNGAFLNSHILNPAGKDNPGGVVSVAAVLTNGTAENKRLRYGVTYFTRASASAKFGYAGSALGDTVGKLAGSGEAEVDGGEILQNVELFNKRISNTYEAMLVPWVIELAKETDTVSVDANGLLTLPLNAKIFSMKFASDYAASARALVANRYIYPMTVQGVIPVTVQHVGKYGNGSLWYLEITVTNQYANYPMSAGLFNLSVGYRIASTGASGTKSISSFVAADEDNPGNATMTVDGTGAIFALLDGPAYDINSRQANIRLYFTLPGENDSVTSYTVGYTSSDSNHGNKAITTEITIRNTDSLSSGVGEIGEAVIE